MTEDRWQTGIDMFEQVYGAGARRLVAGLENTPVAGEVINHLFGEIWTRPGLSRRDKRLLVIGATTMLGRVNLLTSHVAGALASGDISRQEFEEIVLLLLFYAGNGNVNALQQAIGQASQTQPETQTGAAAQEST